MLIMYLNSYPWQKLNYSLLTLVFVELAPRKAVQSYSGFAVQRYMILPVSPSFQGTFLYSLSISCRIGTINSDLLVTNIRFSFHFPFIILVKRMLFGNQWKSREQLQRKKAPSAPNFTHPKLTIYDNKAAGVQGRCFGF